MYIDIYINHGHFLPLAVYSSLQEGRYHPQLAKDLFENPKYCRDYFRKHYIRDKVDYDDFCSFGFYYTLLHVYGFDVFAEDENEPPKKPMLKPGEKRYVDPVTGEVTEILKEG